MAVGTLGTKDKEELPASLGMVPSTMLKDHSYQMVCKLVFLPSHTAELMKLCSRGYKRKVAGIHICKSPCLVSAYVAKVFTISPLQEEYTQLVWPAQWETALSGREQGVQKEYQQSALRQGTQRPASTLSPRRKKNRNQGLVRVSRCIPRSNEGVFVSSITVKEHDGTSQGAQPARYVTL